MKRIFRVKGKPYFTIGAQVRNSSSLSREIMEKNWQAAEKIGFDTLAASVHWSALEPEEGQFDYSQVQMLLDGAKAHGKHLILLWFGAWKNGASQYAPTWVKVQTDRFVRSETVVHQKLMVLSPHCEENFQAERQAYEAFIRYLKENDQEGTVIGIQAENEAGQMGAPRDYSQAGEAVYRSDVPKEVADWAGKGSGSWEELFGDDGAEFCTAYAFAGYINRLVQAGKEIFDLPVYTNVWLGEMYNRVPGIDYPSGGGATKVLDLWKAFTPALDGICPDIYFTDADTYNQICSGYAREDNLLYIPETGSSSLSAVNTVHGIVTHRLTGVHCFGVEHMVDEQGNIRDGSREYSHLVQILQNTKPLLEKYQGTKRLYEVVQYEGCGSKYYDFGDFIGRVVFTDGLGDEYFSGAREYMDAAHTGDDCYKVRGKGFIIYEGNGCFYLAGEGFRLNLLRKQKIELMTNGISLSNFQNLRHQEYLELSEGTVDETGVYHVKTVRTGDEGDYGIWVHYDVGVVRAILRME